MANTRTYLAAENRTPGRWTVSSYSDSKRLIFVGQHIPNAGNYDQSSVPLCTFGSPFFADSDAHKHLQERQICDARLMALAPEFYDYIAKRAAEGDKEAQALVERTKMHFAA